MIRVTACAVLIVMAGLHAGFAQESVVRSSDPVYDFLDRMSARGFVEDPIVVRPVVKSEIGSMLSRVEQRRSSLSTVEQSELAYHLEEFGIRTGEPPGTPARPYSFQYRDSAFSMILDPLLGFGLENKNLIRSIGLRFDGSIGSNFGYAFEFYDNTVNGTNRSGDERFRPDQVRKTTYNPDSSTYGFERFRTSLVYRFMDHARVTLGQDIPEWGSGRRGKIILSNRAPSYPFFAIDADLTSWLRFHYLHGWLMSNILDSTRTYQTPLAGSPRNVYREKYIAAHVFEIQPSRNWNISLGESIVYSDGPPQIYFLIPVMFFRAADHYLTNGPLGDGNNSQFFWDVQYRGVSNLLLYHSMLIDEIRLTGIFDQAKKRNHVAYTFGARLIGFPHPDADITFEWTRLLPWVYSNFTPAQTYRTSGELLGHYLGEDTEQVFGELKWRFGNQIEVTCQADFIRSGNPDPVIDHQYQQPQRGLLEDPVHSTTIVGAGLSWMVVSGLYFKGEFRFITSPLVVREGSNWSAGFTYNIPGRD